MSFNVETVPFDSTDQKDFVLGGWQIAAPLDVGSLWSTIRIGMRYSLTDAGASLGTGPELWFGLLSSPSAGMANGPLTDSTSHFVGINLYDSWTRATSPSNHYDGDNLIRVRVGSTDTDYDAAAAGTITSATPTTIKPAIIVEFVKGSGGTPTEWDVNRIYPNNTSSLVSATMTKAGLIDAMNASSMFNANTVLGAVTGGGYALRSFSPVIVDEPTDGELNAICIAWNSGIASLHTSEAFFRVVA